MADLNPEQQAAVETTEGCVRVVAGAGSGKTRALAHRFAYLVQALGVLPAHILCVTFSNKSAHEMRQRIRALTGDNDTGLVNTFHGFCAGVLREDVHAVGYPQNFPILDNSDIDQILRGIYEERGLTMRDMTFAKARDMFEIRKTLKEPQYCHDLVHLPLEALKRRYDQATAVVDILFYGYLYRQKRCFALDYNDLILFTLMIFDEQPEIRRKWQERLEYVMIDEFQDIDPLQYRLMEVLAAHHGNLFVVGDPDQTIYTWRGANVKYLLEFDRRFPGTKTIVMNRNYRSTPEILAVVNSLIGKNTLRMRKDLVAQKQGGPRVLCRQGAKADDEAAWIAARMRSLHRALHEPRRGHRSRRPGEADDRAHGEGPRVPVRLPLFAQRGRLPGPQDRDPRADGGGAPPRLRRDDARGAGPLPDDDGWPHLRRGAAVPVPLPAGHRPRRLRLRDAAAQGSAGDGASQGRLRAARARGGEPARRRRPGRAQGLRGRDRRGVRRGEGDVPRQVRRPSDRALAGGLGAVGRSVKREPRVTLRVSL